MTYKIQDRTPPRSLGASYRARLSIWSLGFIRVLFRSIGSNCCTKKTCRN